MKNFTKKEKRLLLQICEAAIEELETEIPKEPEAKRGHLYRAMARIYQINDKLK